jgi:hypothetical protein
VHAHEEILKGADTRPLARALATAQDFHGGERVSSDIASTIRERLERRSRGSARRQRRAIAVLLLGPLTMLGGLVWAIAQPYRIAFLYPEGKGLYDYLAQPPLLVVVVGAIFMIFIAPGLAEDLEQGHDGPES